MNQLVNLLSFAMELVFGRDASGRRSRAQTLRSMAVLVVMAASLFTNYYLFKSLYGATARYIAVKEQLRTHNELQERVRYLEAYRESLENVISTLSPGLVVQTLPPLAPSTPLPNPPAVLPAPMAPASRNPESEPTTSVEKKP